MCENFTTTHTEFVAHGKISAIKILNYTRLQKNGVMNEHIRYLSDMPLE